MLPTGPKVTSAEFAFAAAKAEQLPAPTLPEVAFGGRSNVGKSSLLNTLLQRKSLVRTSKTPGCTRQINLFKVKTEEGVELFAVDLPGYGYAVRSKSERGEWGVLIESYLRERESLKALVVIIDMRRGMEDDDRQLVDFWRDVRKDAPLILVATKLDKLPMSKRKPAIEALRKQAGAKRAVGFSSVTGDGRGEVWRQILHSLPEKISEVD